MSKLHPSGQLLDVSMTHSRALSALKRRSDKLRELESTLWPNLPKGLADHCNLANYRNGCLVFVTDSSVWAAKIRLLSGEILHIARARCKISPTQLEVKIYPLSRKVKPKPQEKALSEAASECLVHASATASDPEIAKAMRRILKRKGR